MVDAGAQFCEQCGRDRDSFASARNTYRDCPSCGAACCADCWNLVDEACLACAPFRLTGATTRPRIVIAADAAPPTARVDPYADLRSDPGTLPATDTWAASRGPARQRPSDVAPAGLVGSLGLVVPRTPHDLGSTGGPGSAAAEPRRQRRRAGRVGLAASAAWVVVGALAVVVLGASPARQVQVPDEALPVVSFSPTPRAAPPSPVATPAPAARPTRAPRATAAPRSGGGPDGSGGGTRGTPRATPRPTSRPARPVVVAPPPAPPAPTPAPTPDPTPEQAPTATAESIPAATAQP